MENWREIPGNNEVFDELTNRIGSAKAVAFVGAGASAGLYPMWGELIRRLAERAAAQGADEEDLEFAIEEAASDPQQAVCEIRRHLEPGTYLETLGEIFGPRKAEDGAAFTAIHGHLLRLPFAGYVTTNCDSGLYEARRELRPDSPAISFATPRNKTVVHRWITGDVFADEAPILSGAGGTPALPAAETCHLRSPACAAA